MVVSVNCKQTFYTMNKKLITTLIISIAIIGGGFLWYQSNTLKTVPSNVEVGLLMQEFGFATALSDEDYSFSLSDGFGVVKKNGIEEFALYPLPLIDVKKEYALSGGKRTKLAGFKVYTQEKDGQTTYYLIAPKMSYAIFPTDSETSMESIEKFLNTVFYPEQIKRNTKTRKSDIKKGIIIPATEADKKIVTVEDENHNKVQVDISDWPYYRNEALGFQVRYPKGYEVKEDFKFYDTDDFKNALMRLVFKKNKTDNDLEGYIFLFSENNFFPGTLLLIDGIKDKNNFTSMNSHIVKTNFGEVFVYNLFTSFRTIASWFVGGELFVKFGTFERPISEFQAILSTFEFLE